MLNCTLAVSTAGGALTMALKTLAGVDPSPGDPCTFTFPNSSGGLTSASVTAALSLTVPAGAALAFLANVPGRLWCAALLDTGGIVHLGVGKMTTPTDRFAIDEANPVSAAAISTGSNTAGVIFSDAVLAGAWAQILGYSTWEAGTITAGTWTDPTTTHLRQPGTVLPGKETGRVSDPPFPLGAYSVSTGTGWTNTLSTVSLTLQSAANLVELEYRGEILLATGNTPVEACILRGGTMVSGAMSANSDQTAGTNGIGTPIADDVTDFPMAKSAVWTVALRTKTAQVSTYGGIEADTSAKMRAREFQG